MMQPAVVAGWVQYSNQSHQAEDDDDPRPEKTVAQAKFLAFLKTFQAEGHGQQSGEVYKYRHLLLRC